MTISTIQNGDSGLVARSKINDNFQGLPIPFATVSDMVNTSGLQVGDVALVINYSTTVKSGPLTFVAVPLATGAADGGSYIDGSGVQWEQQFSGKRINAQAFGVGGRNGDAPVDQSDHTRWNRAINYLQANGGGVVYFTGRSTIYGNVIVKSGVSLELAPSYPMGYTVSTLDHYCSIIEYVGDFSIQLKQSSGINGGLYIPYQMTFPQTPEDAETWTGTAITGSGSGTFIKNGMICGFNQAIDIATAPEGSSRATVSWVAIDCNIGIYSAQSLDQDRFENVHIWPFMSQGFGQGIRVGEGFHLNEAGSWARLNSCFAIGHTISFRFTNTTQVSMVNCASDSSEGLVGQICVLVEGTAESTKMAACTFGGIYDIGVKVDLSATAARNSVLIAANTFSGGSATSHIHVVDANSVFATGNELIDGQYGVFIENDTGVAVNLSSNQFKNQTGAVVANATTGFTTNLLNWDASNVVSGSPTQRWLNAVNQIGSLASAATVTIPFRGPVVNLTGTTTITTMNKDLPGRSVTFIVISGLTINEAGTIKLLSGANTTYPAGARMTFISEGFAWYEVSNSL